MSNLFNTLLHGEANEVVSLLSGDHVGEITGLDLQAALTNAFERIDRLEKEAAGTRESGLDAVS